MADPHASGWKRLKVRSTSRLVLWTMALLVLVTACNRPPKTRLGEGDQLYPFWTSEKAGFIDSRGSVVIQPRFDEAGEFAEGLARVKLKGKSGFIGPDGAFRIPPTFDDAASFSEGFASIKIGASWGVIDKSGRIIAPPQFDGPGWFHEGLCVMKLREGSRTKMGFIDKSGRFVIAPRYDDALDQASGVPWPGRINSPMAGRAISGSISSSRCRSRQPQGRRAHD